MIIFPFLGKPILKGITNMSDTDFVQFMQDRKSLIPVWLDPMMKIE